MTDIDRSTPAGQQMAWVLEELFAGGDASDDVLDDRFAPSFLAVVPAAQLRAVAKTVSPRLTDAVVEMSSGTLCEHVVEIGASTGRRRVSLHVEEAAPDRMTGLLIQPIEEEVTVAASVVLLNGTSSSGKSSLAKALQEQLPGCWLHMAVDDFLLMASKQDSSALRIITGFHGCVAAMVKAGNRVIVDHVLQDRAWLEELSSELGDEPVLFVGVHCPVEVLEEREKARGDRLPGMARQQIGMVHGHAPYDVEIDSHASSSADAAAQIATRLLEEPSLTALAMSRPPD